MRLSVKGAAAASVTASNLGLSCRRADLPGVTFRPVPSRVFGCPSLARMGRRAAGRHRNYLSRRSAAHHLPSELADRSWAPCHPSASRSATREFPGLRGAGAVRDSRPRRRGAWRRTSVTALRRCHKVAVSCTYLPGQVGHGKNAEPTWLRGTEPSSAAPPSAPPGRATFCPPAPAAEICICNRRGIRRP